MALLVDHNHDSGLIRGYLCGSCNSREAASLDEVFDQYRTFSPAVLLNYTEVYGAKCISRLTIAEVEKRELRGREWVELINMARTLVAARAQLNPLGPRMGRWTIRLESELAKDPVDQVSLLKLVLDMSEYALEARVRPDDLRDGLWGALSAAAWTSNRLFNLNYRTILRRRFLGSQNVIQPPPASSSTGSVE